MRHGGGGVRALAVIDGGRYCGDTARGDAGGALNLWHGRVGALRQTSPAGGDYGALTGPPRGGMWHWQEQGMLGMEADSAW